MTAFQNLFSPIKIGNVEIPNRIALPPMDTRSATPGGAVTDIHLEYYGARAKGGTGLLIIEAATPNPERKYAPGTLGLFDDSLIPGWKDLADRIHEHGSIAAVQLFDPGPNGGSIMGGKAFGPSPVWAHDVRETPEEPTIEEIRVVIGEYAEAARRAKEAGIDMVQIHAAHAYAMVGSFLSAFYNKRSDEYGGSLEERLKLLLDIIDAIKTDVGADYPIIVRMSGEDRVIGGRSISETQFIAPIIAEAGADAIEISSGTVPDGFWAVVAPSGTPMALNADFAEAVKKVVDIPVISVGRFNNPRIAEFVLQTGKADMVSIGRGLIADPEFANKAREGRIEDIVPCLGDNQGCLVGHPVRGTMTCIMNPSVCREKEIVIAPAETPKKVLVVGGGPAGLEAARVAALRGHDVTLYEKDKRLGGQINIACVPPFKQEMVKMIKYLSVQAKKEGVKVVTGQEVTPELVEEMKPDAVVVASGAAPVVPKGIPGSDGDNVVTAWDVLAGKAGMQSRNIVVVGGGSVGCETADFLADIGDNVIVGKTKVTIVEMLEGVAMDTAGQSRHLLMQRLRYNGVDIMASTKVKKILADGVVVEKNGAEETIEGVDLVVLALGTQPVDSLSGQIKDKVKEVHVIGDAKAPRKAIEAVEEGRDAGRII